MKTVRTFKTARKWDPFRRVYEPCVIDELCSTCEGDMEKIVVCPQCGRKLKFGEAYTVKKFTAALALDMQSAETAIRKSGRENMQQSRDEAIKDLARSLLPELLKFYQKPENRKRGETDGENTNH